MVTAQDIADWTGFRVVNFHYGHIHIMDLTEYSRQTAKNIPDFAMHIHRQSYGNPSFTIIHNGKPAFSFGVVPFWDGVAEVWMVPSTQISSMAVSLVKGCRQFYDHIGTAMQLQRLQFIVRSSHLQAVRFAEAMYFSKEATLAKYGPEGDDYYMYTRFY